MPRESEKTKLMAGLCLKNILDLNNCDTDSSDDEEDIMLSFTINAALLLQNRRALNLGVPKSVDWAQKVLLNFDEGRTQQMLRINKPEFEHILKLIKDDGVFYTINGPAQMPVSLQLQIMLFRLGSSGDSASVRKIATLFGVGDGGTIDIVTKRVIHALLNLKSKYLFWPSEEERKALVAATMHELPGCIGYIDGTEIRLAEAPSKNHELFYSRKKQYCIKTQIICDYRLRIRHAAIGHPGSAHDAKVFAESSIGQAPHLFFSEKQYIAGDSAYPLSRYVVTPFRQNSRELDEIQRIKFNEHFSKARVRVENCFGRLKEKFCSLKEMRFKLTDEANYSHCCNWILACCILHNTLIDFNETESYEISSLEYPPEMQINDNIRNALVQFILNNF